MKRSVFRMMAALLCLVLLPGLAACGKGGKAKPGAAEEAGAGQLPVIAPEWESSFVTLQSDSLWGLRPVRYTDDGFYATATKKLGKREIPEGKAEEFAGQYDVYGTVICFVDGDGKVSVLPKFTPEMPEPDNGRRDFNSFCTLGSPVMNAEGNFEVLLTRDASWYVGPDAVFGNTAYYQPDYYTHETRTEYLILAPDGSDDYLQSIGWRVDRNNAGKEVFQMMFNVQTLGGGWEGNGGDGWLRILEFLPDGKTVKVRTYSPLFGISKLTRHLANRTAPYDQFDFSIEE